MHIERTRRILLTGATGYIGGRLLCALEQTGCPVRCLARHPEVLRARAAPSTEIVKADCLDPSSLTPALEGVHTAYYLVHSMGSAGKFVDEDRQAASNFAEAARTAGVRRLIYLGGLGEARQELSDHLRSRQEVADILRSSGIPTVEFRASIVIGSGSLSFEMIRALVQRLPVMICPKWVSVKAQPIAVEDVISYLVQALELPESTTQIYEIGGTDQVSYGDIMQEYARQCGLHRVMISVPVLTPRLSSLWLGLVTPVYARIGRKLVDSLRNPTLVTDPSALEVFHIQPRGLKEAIARALINEDHEFAQTRWSDAFSSAGPAAHGSAAQWGGARLGTRIVDSRVIQVATPPSAAFAPVRRIGGERGWYFATFLWQIRGFLDLLMGGVGLRRGRKDAEHVSVGDALDFWRVEQYEPDRLLRLSAEMKVPGRAWLQFEVQPEAHGSTIRQTAIFDPAGLAGLLYWYMLYPVHRWIFAGMLHEIARLAVQSAMAEAASPPVPGSLP